MWTYLVYVCNKGVEYCLVLKTHFVNFNFGPHLNYEKNKHDWKKATCDYLLFLWGGGFLATTLLIVVVVHIISLINKVFISN